MVQASDITIAGVGYMVVPGSYKRMSDAATQARTERWEQTDFVGGQRRAFALERDRGWDQEGVGPALGGQGVEPWPLFEAYADAALAGKTASLTQRNAQAVAGSRSYVAIGRYLFESVLLTAGAWADVTQRHDAGAGVLINDMSAYQDNIAICYGTAADIRILDVSAGTTAVLLAGEKGGVCVGYAGRLLYSNPAAASNHVLKMTTGGAITSRLLDSPIVRMALHGGKAIIATRTSLYQLGGKSDAAAGTWIGEPEPLFTHGIWTGDQDYIFLTSYGGKLYTWLAGRVMEWNPNSGASKQGWRDTGIEGAACYGGVVAGDRLVVVVKHRLGPIETWTYDGIGWWKANHNTSADVCWPWYLAGAGTYDLILFRPASTTYQRSRLVFRSTVNHNYSTATSRYLTSVLDAGDRASIKAWLNAGAAFHVPEIRGDITSIDTVTMSLEYSINNGSTFTSLVSAAYSDPAVRNNRIEANFGAGIESQTLMLRVVWTGVTDWAPTLTSIWVDYSILGDATRKRRWQFKVNARDALILRSSAIESRTAVQLVADLWAAWSAGTSVLLRDIDYDDAATEYQTRIIAISEERKTPANIGALTASELTLTLIQL